jgi:hypothetical protein
VAGQLLVRGASGAPGAPGPGSCTVTPDAIAVWVVTGVSVAAAVLLVLAYVTRRREDATGFLAFTAGAVLAYWAAVGWAWWLADGSVH